MSAGPVDAAREPGPIDDRPRPRVAPRFTRRRPLPFLRFSRAQYEQLLDGLYDQRDRAIGQARAARDRAAALIEAAADAHEQDAKHLDRLVDRKPGASTEKLTAAGHRAVEHALRAVARDIEEDR